MRRGAISITGRADQLDVRRAHVGAEAVGAKFAAVEARTLARAALIQLGWKPAIASAAVDAAIAHVGATVPLETLIREALRHCSG